MKHLTTAALCLKLQSSNVMDRAFAAEELGRRRATESVGALCGFLLSITTEHARGIDAAPFAIDALAEIGDPRAARAIFEVLRLTAGTFLLPELEPISSVACRALVKLRATAMLPGLRELQRGRAGFLYRDLVARTIAKLGGEEEAPFFLQLLESPSAVVRAAACSALGVLRHPPAGPALEQLALSPDDGLRWAALGACVAMGRPGALDAFLHEAHQLEALDQKLSLLYMTLDQQLTAAAGALCELSCDPRWVCCPSILLFTLEAAVRLGSDGARAQVRAIRGDEQASPCARARAAAILLAHTGDVEMVAHCFAFLRDCTDPTKRDPRDDRARRSATQLQVIECLERFGRDFPDHRGRLADGLYEILWREETAFLGGAHDDELELEDELDDLGMGSIPDRAGHALYSLTGASSRPELERWKRAEARIN